MDRNRSSLTVYPWGVPFPCLARIAAIFYLMQTVREKSVGVVWDSEWKIKGSYLRYLCSELDASTKKFVMRHLRLQPVRDILLGYMMTLFYNNVGLRQLSCLKVWNPYDCCVCNIGMCQLERNNMLEKEKEKERKQKRKSKRKRQKKEKKRKKHTSKASSSAGGTWKPLYLMSSLTLSTMNTCPCLSIRATSPVWRNPSQSIQLVVSLGLLR